MRTLLTLLSLAFAATLTLAGCSSPAPVTVGEDAVIIDVRTPAEYAEGHLDGAVNIDVSSPAFADAIAELPADGEYVVYCRSGNRSAQAASIMRDHGFEHVIDAGALSDASTATGFDIVTE